ncbi:pectinesterase family protein [Chitinophagaceae bacterium MMS25-I14]
MSAFCGSGQKKMIVAVDGSGDYTTVQAAFDAVPANNKTAVIINVRKGIYKEKVHLDAGKNFVTLLGADAATTILTYDDHTGRVMANGDTVNTFSSQTFLLAADDFRAEDITIQNDAGMTAGQAVALNVKGDRAIFKHCRFTGFQDVLFTSAENSRQYYRDCYIEGTTDFIFGPSTAIFDSCEVHSKKNSHVTAASTPASHLYGYVFRNCKLTADPGVNKVSLGRPWRPYANVTYTHCDLGSHIIPAGWDNWKNAANEQTARFSEYKNTGPGAADALRAGWAKQLTDKEAKEITITKVLGDWVPQKDTPAGEYKN